MAEPENSAAKQDGRFQKGVSGNPRGKPRGARHAVTLMLEKLMADDATAVVRAVIDKAVGGDMVAARIVVERLVPPRRDRAVQFPLPALDTAEDIACAGRGLMKNVAAAEITPLEASDVMNLFASLARAIEVSNLAQRLDALERKSGGEDGNDQ